MSNPTTTRGRELNFNGTVVLQKNLAATTRFVANQGGSRSSKTFSICQLIVIRAHEVTGKVITIARKTLPALRGSMMRDFFEVLRVCGLYEEANHNKTAHTYLLNGNTIEFVSADQPSKIRGRKRWLLVLNECTEFDEEDFFQFVLRTTGQIFIDFNPDAESWIYDKVLSRDDVTLIKSTYLDNPFLEAEVIKEIERLKEVSPVHWTVFGLGERGFSEEVVYTNWRQCEKLAPGDNHFFGLDFGFNHPTALVEVVEQDGEYYTDELIYESKLTGGDLVQRMMGLPDIKTYPIYCDHARPEMIEELSRAGFKVFPADKSVKDGIDFVKRHIVHVTKPSVNLWKERASYKWMKDKSGRVLDEPVKFRDDLMDALRYGIYTNHKRTRDNYKTYITQW